MSELPKVGQIWREIDKRFTRFVRIEGVGRHTVTLQSVVRDGNRWIPAQRSRKTQASPHRFTDKPAYEFVAEAQR